MSASRRNIHIPSAALTAGALQDHLLHDLSIGNLSLESPLHSYSDLKKKLHNNEKKRRQALKNVKSTVDTGRSKKTLVKASADESEREYVLDPLPKPSLAQKLGLISLPDKPLTDEEWTSVKERSRARDDFKNPCAICQEYFATEDQVLLSCSHVFHRACIKAFERFTGRKTCPMCRKIQYQARVVHDGTKAYRERAAVRIQSCWRGYVVRKWYYELRRTVPPKNRELRRRFYEDKLREITDRMVAMASSDVVDRFLEEMDSSIASSRAVFQHFEDSRLCRLSEEDWVAIEVKALQRNDTDCPICLRALLCCEDQEKVKVKKPETPKTTKLKKKARSNCTKGRTPSSTTENNPEPASKLHPTALLSCSHIFHHKCLQALEDFCFMESNIGENQNLAFGDPGFNLPIGFHLKCPVCRALYVKRVLY